MTYLDVLVTCFEHDRELVHYPQVRGHYLAKQLAKAGLRAEFRHLPQPGLRCQVLICSEYQCELPWFERCLAQPLAEISAERMYCMIAYPVLARGHFSSPYCEWFARRGGVLTHLDDETRSPDEYWIGVGVDTDVVPSSRGPHDSVLFDFPRSERKDAAAGFDVSSLDLVRARLRDCRIVGTGHADSVVRDAFDQWLPYGLPHREYVARAFDRVFAVVPGTDESMGLMMAEAQVAGSCLVSRNGQLKPPILCSEAALTYEREDPTSLASALEAARSRDPDVIARQARERFDFARVVDRVRRAIGI